MNIPLVGTKVFAVSFLIFAAAAHDARAQRGPDHQVNAGTRFLISIDDPVGSDFSSPEDTFTATLIKPILKGDRVIVAAGAKIHGRVIEAVPAGRSGRAGKLIVEFYAMRLKTGERLDIDAVLIGKREARSRKTLSWVTALGGTAAGTALGAASGDGRGALLGAAAGAAAGTGAATLIKGDDLELAAGEELEAEMKHDVVLPTRAI